MEAPARRASISQAARESWARNFTLGGYHRQVLEAMERAGKSSS